MVQRLTVLYSNTPNPIVEERLRLLKQYYDLSIVYTEREKSELTLSIIKQEGVTYSCLRVRDYRGFDLRKVFSNLRLLKKVSRKTDYLYALYPDMLFNAVIYKLFYNYNVKIVYEIQDLISDNIFFKNFHNFLMRFCKKVFLTSPFFITDLNNAALRKSVYIGNRPDNISYTYLQSGENDNSSRPLTVGLIGNLRDLEQVRHIKKILDETNLHVLQAGASDYKCQLRKLQKKYMDRLSLIDTFHYSDLGAIYSKVDIVWAVYPESYNYTWHIARRAHEALLLNKKLVISAHAKGMRSYFASEDRVISYNSDVDSLGVVLKIDKPAKADVKETTLYDNKMKEAILDVFEN